MTYRTFSTLRAHREFVAAMAGLMGLFLGASFASSMSSFAVANSASTEAAPARDRCAGGTEVSAFVCRNTWMAYTKR